MLTAALCLCLQLPATCSASTVESEPIPLRQPHPVKRAFVKREEGRDSAPGSGTDATT